MNERLRLLQSELVALRETIDEACAALEAYPGPAPEKETTSVVGYHLHGLHGAFENAFQRIAETFENEVPDPSRCHAPLLGRISCQASFHVRASGARGWTSRGFTPASASSPGAASGRQRRPGRRAPAPVHGSGS